MLPTSCVRSGEIPVIENDQQAEEPSTLDDTVNPLKQPVLATVRDDDVLETAHWSVSPLRQVPSVLTCHVSPNQASPAQLHKRKPEEEQADEHAIEPYQYRDPPQTKFPKHDCSNDSNFALIQMLRADNRRLSKENRSFAKASWETMRHQRDNQALTGRIQSMESETIPSLLSRVKALEGREKGLKEENGKLSQRLEMYKAKFGTLSEETSIQKEDRHELGGASGSKSVAKENEGESYWSDEEVAAGRTSGRRRDDIYQEEMRRGRLHQFVERQEKDRIFDGK